MLYIHVDKGGGSIRIQAFDVAQNTWATDVVEYPPMSYSFYTEREAIAEYRERNGLVGRKSKKEYRTVYMY